MGDSEKESSGSDLDDINWFKKKRKQFAKSSLETSLESSSTENKHSKDNTVAEKNKKFEELQKKSERIRSYSAHRLVIAEKRKTKRLIKKALRDPHVKHLVERKRCASNDDEQVSEKKEEQWNEVKPYLNVNSHLQGPVSHGEWGPKNEIETMIDDAINEGDFEKAELLSDTLASKQFAGKICKAFAAKREHEIIEKQKAIEKAKKLKKIRWTFEAKEKWQMKGNM
ncbi:unnamed protein product [Larinioides sclopetarius]|uniref:Protein FAM204A n=1 Tax=Larinioides sclopetarius TaxID=280406 RepID=A0AAV1ZA72_9ARAC